MALSDWIQQFNVGDNFLDDSRSFEGSSSLRMKYVDATMAYIWPPSRPSSDSPAEGRLETRTYIEDDTGTAAGFIFRANNEYVDGTDSTDHYFAWFGWDNNRNEFKFQVDSYAGRGPRWPNDNYRTIAPDASDFANQWTPYRIDFWVDENDDLRIQAFHDSDLSGSWTLVNDVDIVDTNPRQPNGGGMGFGSDSSVESNNDVWYEESKVYY